jgi:putative DNA primase/helicase
MSTSHTHTSASATDSIDNALLDAAVAYAARGWQVFPLHSIGADGTCTCHDPACTSVGKHPRTRHGVKDATTDPRTIGRWWRHWPEANVGLATGRVSCLVVIDIDEDEGGRRAPLEPLPPTLAARTGDGEHLYFHLPADRVIQSKGGKTIAPGIHVRGEGGYVVAPPSRHASGRLYAWQQDTCAAEPTVLPDHLVRLLTGTAGITSSTTMLDPEAPPQPHENTQASEAGTAAEPDTDQAGSDQAGAEPGLHGDVGVYWLGQALTKVQAGAGRNDTGFWLACQLRDDGLDKVAAAEVLHTYARQVEHQRDHPYPAREALASLDQAFGQAPREPAQRGGQLPALAPVTAADACTDTGNAKRLALAYGRVLRFVPEWGCWVAYQDGVWRRHATALARQYARATVEAIHQEASAALAAGDVTRYDQLTRHLTRSFSAGRLKALLDVAQTDLTAHPTDFDRDPWLLNVQNGTLDLRTGTLHPHQPEDLLTRQAPVTFDASATAPAWNTFLSEVFYSDAALIGYVQRALGYSCTAETREQAFFLCYGAGANGKTTLLNAVAQVLGAYWKPLKADVLMARPSGAAGPDPELASLVGARLVTAQEPHGATLDTPRLKELTGSDAIQVRELRRAPFTFIPHFKLWLSANERPAVPERTVGIWRRIRLLPFTVSFRGRENRALPGLLAAEAPGILTWLLAGVQAWLDDGLGMVPAVAEATAAYQAEEDAYFAFFHDVLVPASREEAVRLKAAYAAYEAWAMQADAPELSIQEFAKEAEAHGATKVKRQGLRWLRGCTLSFSTSATCGSSPSGGVSGEGVEGVDDSLFLGKTPRSGIPERQPENETIIGTHDTQGHNTHHTSPAQRRERGGDKERERHISQAFYTWLRQEAQLDDEDIDELSDDEWDIYREEYAARDQ